MAMQDCWEWKGQRSPEGYGRQGILYAHRVAYEREHGPVPEGYVVHHTCHNRGCVNPAHLEAYSHGFHPDAAPALNRAKRRCKHGHLFDAENTHHRPDGSRFCRTCSRLRAAHYRQTGTTRGALV
jgi:hypothetical protein